MWKRAFTISAALLASSANPAHAQSSEFTVALTWQGTAACFDPKSPPFSVSSVPAGTRTLRFVMKDLDAPSFPHGGGSVPYIGQSQIERGAFSYQGPCPPRGQHSYQWTVEALDAAGKTLATATTTRKFPER